MKKWITMGLVASCMLILQACTTPEKTNEVKVIEPLPADPTQAAAFLGRSPTETWIELIKPSENEERLEINGDRVTRSDSGLSTVWLRQDLLGSVVLANNSRQAVVQTLIQAQVRCRDNQYRYLNFYALDNNKNIVDIQQSPQAEFLPLGSGAAAAGMYRIACEITSTL